MIVLDTTVLVYAKGADHPLRDPSRRLIAAVADRELQATTTVEVIQEFVHVRARRRGRADAVALGNDYSDLSPPCWPSRATTFATDFRYSSTPSSLARLTPSSPPPR